MYWQILSSIGKISLENLSIRINFNAEEKVGALNGRRILETVCHDRESIGLSFI